MKYTRFFFLWQVLLTSLLFPLSSFAQYQYLWQVGSGGTEDGKFASPQGITVDEQGNIYVADQNNHRVQKFSSSGNFLMKFGSVGSDNGQFNRPTGITVDEQGNIYVADQYNQRIQKFNSSGSFLMKFGSVGTEDGEFSNPQGIALDGQGNIYVADKNNNRIQKFNSSGNFLMKFGSYGPGEGQFNEPTGITLDEQGNIYVADYVNQYIQKFNSNGSFLMKFGSYGSGEGQFYFPKSVVVDEQGNIYVADWGNHRIQKFNSSGSFLMKFGSYGPGEGQFNEPTGITLDEQGNIYVADQENHRIQKFAINGTEKQTINFAPLPDKSFSDTPFILSATATSGLAISFTVVSGPATLSENTLTLTGVGIITVKATQVGNSTYEAAPEVTQSFCVLSLKPVISSSGITLSSSSTTGNQWYLNGQAIAGATAQTYLATIAGSYTVALTGPCGTGVSSDAFQVTVSATEQAFSSQVILYPNPATERVVLQLSSGITYQRSRLFDINGKQVDVKTAKEENKVVFSTHHLSQGVYLLEVQTSSGLIYRKFLVQ